jgi:hypothetical protein
MSFLWAAPALAHDDAAHDPGLAPTAQSVARAPCVSPGSDHLAHRRLGVDGRAPPAGWVYFDLTRIQDEVLKAGSSTVFLQVDGVGTTSPVPIPGMKEPLMMYDGKTTFTATWYMRPEMEAAHERQVSGK